ncbi:U8-agatoxin-Ao1a-like [Argiope bruennichi]|uniref:U8-agatoxin-Ao1a-like n=1 Tax=Argiope bruennichi TaxID=94029 RepID=UPI00249540B8|nr:U8-agatoxin-Ao1a-like [Argiope bruennichi]
MDRFLLVFIISCTILAHAFLASSYMATSDADSAILNDYPDVARLMYYARKRSCLKRGMSCDHRPNDCCYNSSCRCNLWGTNCRCQRMGLFQKWGK